MSISFNDILTKLDALYEAKEQRVDGLKPRTLLNDLKYFGDVAKEAAGDPISIIFNKDTGKVIDAFNELGYMTADDAIIIPANTKAYWRETKDDYDLYQIRGNKYAYIAIPCEDADGVFKDE